MPFDPQIPFDDLPLLAAASISDADFASGLIEARAALARLDAAVQYAPFADILCQSIPLVEARTSSAIENIVTTQDELFTADFRLVSASSKNPLALVGRYHNAMAIARQELGKRPITMKLAQSICTEITGHDADLRRGDGTLLVSGSGAVVYTPPSNAAALDRLISDWEAFINSSTLDPLLRMAIGHYQFEAIHPFYDGNGRTGRIINLLLLESAGLLHQPVLHLSRDIKATSADYYSLLRSTSSTGDYSAWVEYVLERIVQAAEAGLRQLDLLGHYIERVQRFRHPDLRNGPSEALLNGVLNRPYTKTAHVMATCEVSRPTATKWLDALVEGGVLDTVKMGREKYFTNRAILKALYI